MIVSKGILGIFSFITLALYDVHCSYCEPVTQWLDKTIYKPVPIYKGGKASRDHYEPVYQTKTLINTQSVPYFVTQTQNVPQFVTRKATLPQYVTHTVVHTHPKYLTVTEKTFITVTATRTRKTYETICPKGYGFDHPGGGYGHGGGGYGHHH
ncbi:hypothetical protein Avbf_02449 [Armadillidium vulgare]|nr:hypothetical protein Avbf_02449 [Armadillidium vulgare]